MPLPPETRSPLSPHRAFVVWFRRQTGLQYGRWVGRAEHVMSGAGTRFETLEELLEFIDRVLGEVQGQHPDEL
jgi:hypothetical protein